MAIPYPMGIHNLEQHDPHDKSRSKSLTKNDLGIDLTHPITYSGYGDPDPKRFKNFYDAAYGSWTYLYPDTGQIIMNMPNRLFNLGPNVGSDPLNDDDSDEHRGPDDQ